MTSDFAIPNPESNSALPDAESISHLSDVDVNSNVFHIESNSTVSEPDPHSVIPDTELSSVLLYLKSNSPPLVLNPDSVPQELESTAPLQDVELNSASRELELNLAKDLEPNLEASNTEASSTLWDVTEAEVDNRLKNIQVQFKHEAGKLLVILPTESQLPASEIAWADIWQQLKLRLNAGDRLRIPNTPVHLIAYDRLLDSRQLQDLADSFSEVQLQLKCVATSRRQTAIAAVTSGYSVEQLQPQTSLSSEAQITTTSQADALYLEMTVRSGVEIRHPGTVILLGDVNPGGIVVAEGDILVWGRLRGIAHAGAGGNRECLIMALQMEPTQLRIADAVARAPEKLPSQFSPEVAHITPQGIRIARATDFSRNQLARINQVP
ncbi:septum site-determining protein MinC [Nostoc sp. HK-01]|uniref:Probable septum site-determining protein MinC n=1 Tax=Nostoc cycadae WK-1 TaxID=1861711 RepID=A0A2H6LAP5_9NOSO|nr:septum site-determining protein MinC [Nostoc cycadae]BBD57260.1 septum site-determining protein MinC [Nostoc sp. HK-01]GBE90307.1 septum site-determining protein MinC [Nostoc cycadae WK-1]